MLAVPMASSSKWPANRSRGEADLLAQINYSGSSGSMRNRHRTVQFSSPIQTTEAHAIINYLKQQRRRSMHAMPAAKAPGKRRACVAVTVAGT